MSHIPRVSKPVHEWTSEDLEAYNIKLEYQDSSRFFELKPNEQLPEAQVLEPELLTVRDAWSSTKDDTYTFLRLLKNANMYTVAEETAVVDFTFTLMRMIGYTSKLYKRIVRTRKRIQILIAGELKDSVIDLCLIDENGNMLLVIQEDKRALDSHASDPTAQVIAAAIATVNDRDNRRRALGLAPVQSKIIPAIIMYGSAPTFYKIPVTSELTKAIAAGEFPQHETIIPMHIPVVPRRDRRLQEGMDPLENRRPTFRCFEALKKFFDGP
ncbi:hypothetical protein QCA50_008708 [Cerrena zonata]|uniref:Uncharacterized protein n=1 Tax=Cerrena zonata TaxID=2478898 RepID=A0AAW0GFS5_9APHY